MNILCIRCEQVNRTGEDIVVASIVGHDEGYVTDAQRLREVQSAKDALTNHMYRFHPDKTSRFRSDGMLETVCVFGEYWNLDLTVETPLHL